MTRLPSRASRSRAAQRPTLRRSITPLPLLPALVPPLVPLLVPLLLLAFTACASSPGPTLTPAEMARRDGGRPPYTRADVVFMQGMIGHHAQAITMSEWAATHGASPSLRILAERIAVSQQDEIAFMKRWLGDRGETVPVVDRGHAMHDTHAPHGAHAGDTASGMMPGMLSPAELQALDAARGAEFDRLFLQGMIRHHEGALTMVQQLLAAPGAAQDDEVYRFIADVNVDQETEIARMTHMLESMRPRHDPPPAAASRPAPTPSLIGAPW